GNRIVRETNSAEVRREEELGHPVDVQAATNGLGLTLPKRIGRGLVTAKASSQKEAKTLPPPRWPELLVARKLGIPARWAYRFVLCGDLRLSLCLLRLLLCVPSLGRLCGL